MARRIRARLVLQLSEAGLSGRRIAATQGVSRNSVSEVLAAAAAVPPRFLRTFRQPLGPSTVKKRGAFPDFLQRALTESRSCHARREVHRRIWGHLAGQGRALPATTGARQRRERGAPLAFFRRSARSPTRRPAP